MTKFQHIALESLQPGRYQPRQDFDSTALQELADSILALGIIEPLVVREIAANRYEIIAGERRWRAAKLAGLTALPCVVGLYTDQQACAVTLIENIQRQDLNLIEEAQGYRRLMDEFHFHQEEIAAWIGKSRSHIANLVRLLTLCSPVQKLLCEKKLSLGHARVLVGLNPIFQEKLAVQTVDENWSVRHLEQTVKNYKHKEFSPQSGSAPDTDRNRLQEILAEQIGAPVQISNENNQGGWLKVKFFDNDTLEGLLERFGLRYD